MPVPAAGGLDHERTLMFPGQTDVQPFADLGHYLVVRQGANPGARVEINDRPCVLGRAEDCHLRLPDPAVSSRHCRVQLVGPSLRIEDLGSTNGTFIDGVQITGPCRVKPGTVLQVGSQILNYEQRSRHDVEQTSRLAKELERARAYVEALLPARLDADDVRCDWCFVPCAVLGGDAFGYHRLEDGRLAIYLIDVCGHGAAAALHSVSVINTVRRQALVGVDFGDPASVLAKLNSVFPMDDHDGMFFSAWYGVYAPDARELTFATAGHPPALLASPANASLVPLSTRRLGVGVIPETTYTNVVAAIPPGSVLYLYSDGIFEFKTAGGARWTHDAFRELVARRTADAASEVVRIRDAVWRTAGTSALPDDLSLVVFDFV